MNPTRGGWLILLTVAGGFGWAIGNLSSRQAQAPNPFHLTMWMTVVPPVPMIALSLLVEGPARIGEALGWDSQAQAAVIERSLCISADGAHATRAQLGERLAAEFLSAVQGLLNDADRLAKMEGAARAIARPDAAAEIARAVLALAQQTKGGAA